MSMLMNCLHVEFAMRTSHGSFLRTTRHGHRHGYGKSPTTTKTYKRD